MGHLEGKVAVVTGGGRGIGRAHALALAREGAAVLVNDLGAGLDGDGTPSAGPAQEVTQAIIDAGGRAVADTTDISDWDKVETIVDAAVEEFGRLDIVVNNAGVARFGTIDRVTRHDWERTINVGLTGTGALSHWAAAHWRSQGPEAGRRIINTASSVGLTPQEQSPMYVAAKAGVAALTIACAIELAELGVRVNALAPVARSRISEFVAGPLVGEVPVGFDRMAPEHVGTFGAYLASPQCRFTGRIFGVVGDDVTLFNGWSADYHIANGEQAWTVEALEAALNDVPSQQDGWAQGIQGTDKHLTPSNAVLEQLTSVEQL